MPALDTRSNPHYLAVAEFYGDRCAKRSGVPLIWHIDEGLRILDWIGASLAAHEAYCLHPLFQGDAELSANLPLIETFGRLPLVLVVEYRSTANACLSQRPIVSSAEIALSPLKDVNDMLIADKIQNRKDFERHHKATHPRSEALDLYFRFWLERLGVDEATYQQTVARLDA